MAASCEGGARGAAMAEQGFAWGDASEEPVLQLQLASHARCSYAAGVGGPPAGASAITPHGVRLGEPIDAATRHAPAVHTHGRNQFLWTRPARALR